MDLVVGAICDGKVSGIMKFGAFVSLPGGKSGLVHISEIAFAYVNEVKDYLTEGQDVKVKIIGIDEAGKINLSIKKAEERPPASGDKARPMPYRRQATGRAPARERDNAVQQPLDATFEDKLKQFMQDSDNKISGIKKLTDRRGSASRRKSR